jgi:hypothetical protein
MKSRVEHNRLWYHQHPPAKVDEDEGNIRVFDHPKVGENLFDTVISSDSDCVRRERGGVSYNKEWLRKDSLRADEAGPEIQSVLAQVREPQPHVKLNADVPSRADKGGHGHGDRQIIFKVLGHAHARD